MQLSRFGVLVAQLESIVASAAHKPPDALLCFDLLSDLIAAIEEEPKVCDSYSLFPLVFTFTAPNVAPARGFVLVVEQIFGARLIGVSVCSVRLL